MIACDGSLYLAGLAVEDKCGERRLGEVRGEVRDRLRVAMSAGGAPNEVVGFVVDEDGAEVLARACQCEYIPRG